MPAFCGRWLGLPDQALSAQEQCILWPGAGWCFRASLHLSSAPGGCSQDDTWPSLLRVRAKGHFEIQPSWGLGPYGWSSWETWSQQFPSFTLSEPPRPGGVGQRLQQSHSPMKRRLKHAQGLILGRHPLNAC